MTLTTAFCADERHASCDGTVHVARIGQPFAEAEHRACGCRCHAPIDAVAETALNKGQTYVGAVTGMLNGKRVSRDVTFTAARDQDPEPFIRDRESTPDQDRVFVVHSHGSAPQLFVTGSIREAVAS